MTDREEHVVLDCLIHNTGRIGMLSILVDVLFLVAAALSWFYYCQCERVANLEARIEKREKGSKGEVGK